jgi:hypothetical protein
LCRTRPCRESTVSGASWQAVKPELHCPTFRVSVQLDYPSPMKNCLRLLCASLLLASAGFAASAFEGTVNFKISDPKEKPMDMSYSIKGDKLRLDMAGMKDAGVMIVDMKKKEMMMIMKEEKMYMTMALSDVEEAAKKNADESPLEKTSETERILGYTATKYISTDKKKKTSTDLWLAEGVGSFVSMSSGGGRSSKSAGRNWEKLLAGKDLFPLRVVEKDKSGKETYRMDVTAIEKKSLPDSLFAAPAGYEKFDMGGMMKGMIPGFGK